MKKVATFALMLFLGLYGLYAGNPPAPTSSKFLKTTGGGFALVLTEDGKGIDSCKYTIFLAPTNKSVQTLYLKVRFENPQDAERPLVVEEILAPDTETLMVKSAEVRGLKQGKNYKVMVEVYDSASHTNKIGEHVQFIRSGRNVR